MKCIGEKFVILEWQGNEMLKLEQQFYYKQETEYQH